MSYNLARKEPEFAVQVQQAATDSALKIVIVGHVDHGKSTFVGRLLHDTGSLPDGKFEQIQQSCKKRGMPFEWSFLMDALQAERDQGITIDTTQIWFKTQARNYVVIDAPGHKEFLKNMISGAAQSEAALLIIDAKEGVKEQSKRHGYLLHLLGVRQIAVLVNKMDMVGYDEQAFRKIEDEYRTYLKEIGVTPAFVIPVSAREGDNIAARSPQMGWYKGPSVLEALDGFSATLPLNQLPLRFPVQDVYKFDERRIIVGRIESGSLKVGDELVFSPVNRTVKVASIEEWGSSILPISATAGQSVGITLSEQIFVERGAVASHTKHAPFITNMFRAKLFWLGHKPLTQGKRYKLKIATTEVTAEVREIEQVVDTNNLGRAQQASVERGAVAEVVFHTRGVVALDAFEHNPKLGRFVILEDYDVCGGGIIDLEGFHDQRVSAERVKSQNITAVDSRITPVQRSLANGHQGGILWFTGLSGSGKSTIAQELQQRLFAKGYQTYVLDGDNVRSGLNKDLGFSAKDRTENIRRIGEVATLFAQAGMIVIASFISPYRDDRRRARAAGGDYFNMVYVKTDINTCIARDPKGLYRKALTGEIPEFTGVSAPYEEPENPELIIDTAQLSVEESVTMLMEYVQKQFVEPVKDLRDVISGGI
ncbi:MAG TPA: adenylyl-sulfate kinase [Rickettsiales bacterium]|nr:adenylyl-sulfate kinase [Rickettsiales bacterium]